MIAVSDASPLITLAKIGCLQHLQSLLGTIYIPPEVERELAAKGSAQGVPDILTIMKDWVIVQAPISLLSIPGLDIGETAAISLAYEQQCRLLIDEKAGRNAAAVRGVKIIGTVGLLVELAERRQLKLTEAFQQLQSTNFHISAALLDIILQEFLQRYPE